MQRTGAAARKTTKATDNVVSIAAAPAPAPAPVGEEDDWGSIDQVLQELGGVDGACVSVFRYEQNQPKPVYVNTYSIEEVEGEASLLEMVRSEFGGGSYRFHVRDGSGFAANRRVTIAQRKTAAPDPSGMSPALVAMFERQAAQFAQLMQGLQQQQRPAESEDASLNRIKAIADILKPSGRGDDGGRLMDMMMRGIELGKSMQPPQAAGAEDVLAASLNAFAPLLRDAADRSRATRVAPKPAARQAAPSAPVPTPAAQPAADEAPAATDDASLGELLSIVLRGAQRGAQPELYAELVIDQVGAEEVESMVGSTDGPGLVTMLQGVEPRVAQHAEWFVQLHAAIVDQLSVETEGQADGNTVAADATAAGPGGSGAHVVDHG